MYPHVLLPQLCPTGIRRRRARLLCDIFGQWVAAVSSTAKQSNMQMRSCYIFPMRAQYWHASLLRASSPILCEAQVGLVRRVSISPCMILSPIMRSVHPSRSLHIVAHAVPEAILVRYGSTLQLWPLWNETFVVEAVECRMVSLREDATQLFGSLTFELRTHNFASTGS